MLEIVIKQYLLRIYVHRDACYSLIHSWIGEVVSVA